MLISPSRDVDVSLIRDSYLKSVRLGGFKIISMEMSHSVFFNFKILRIKIRAQASTFSSYEVFFIFRAECRGGVKCLWECELMRGPLP